jgi:hypothetical protein
MNFNFRNRVDNRPYAERIRGLVREAFGLGEESTISVMEMRCPDPDCPPHETIIAILDTLGDPRRYRFGKPMAEIGREGVIRLGSL